MTDADRKKENNTYSRENHNHQLPSPQVTFPQGWNGHVCGRARHGEGGRRAKLPEERYLGLLRLDGPEGSSQMEKGGGCSEEETPWVTVCAGAFSQQGVFRTLPEVLCGWGEKRGSGEEGEQVAGDHIIRKVVSHWKVSTTRAGSSLPTFVFPVPGTVSATREANAVLCE